MAQIPNSPPAPQIPMTPANKETSTKSTTAARITATCGPAATAAELRKSKRKKAGPTATNDAVNNAQLVNALQTQAEAPEPGTESPSVIVTTDTPNATAPNNSNGQAVTSTLQPIPLPSFFEESLDLPASPSPNSTVEHSQRSLFAALQNEAVTSTPHANTTGNPFQAPTGREQNQVSPTLHKSIKERILNAEERGSTLGNVRPNARNPLDKYTKAAMPDIHYAHPTAAFDHLDVDLVGDWETLPNGKLLAQPFGPDARSAEKHPQLKALLFAAVVEITNSHDVSVSAPRPKTNSYKTPFSFLIYNLTEQQVQLLLERRVWSSTAITFSVSTFNPDCPNYLFSIKGLTTMDTPEVHKIVNGIWQDQTSVTFLMSTCQLTPESPPNQATLILQQFVNSLKVYRLDTRARGNALAPVYNVYANGSIIGNDDIWTQIRSFYASRTYALQAQDPGVPTIAPFKCGICHAADHPRGLCPFPNIEGWNGPKRRDNTTLPGGTGGSPGPGPGPDGPRK